MADSASSEPAPEWRPATRVVLAAGAAGARRVRGGLGGTVHAVVHQLGEHALSTAGDDGAAGESSDASRVRGGFRVDDDRCASSGRAFARRRGGGGGDARVETADGVRHVGRSRVSRHSSRRRRRAGECARSRWNRWPSWEWDREHWSIDFVRRRRSTTSSSARGKKRYFC